MKIFQRVISELKIKTSIFKIMHQKWEFKLEYLYIIRSNYAALKAPSSFEEFHKAVIINPATTATFKQDIKDLKNARFFGFFSVSDAILAIIMLGSIQYYSLRSGLLASCSFIAGDLGVLIFESVT